MSMELYCRHMENPLPEYADSAAVSKKVQACYIQQHMQINKTYFSATNLCAEIIRELRFLWERETRNSLAKTHLHILLSRFLYDYL